MIFVPSLRTLWLFFLNDKTCRFYMYTTKKDGTLLIKMEAPISPELVTWILGWHTAIKVTKPGSLIEDITQKLEETLKMYK